MFNIDSFLVIYASVLALLRLLFYITGNIKRNDANKQVIYGILCKYLNIHYLPHIIDYLDLIKFKDTDSIKLFLKEGKNIVINERWLLNNEIDSDSLIIKKFLEYMFDTYGMCGKYNKAIDSYLKLDRYNIIIRDLDKNDTDYIKNVYVLCKMLDINAL